MAGAEHISLRLPGIAGHIGADAGGDACTAGGGLSYQPGLSGRHGGHFRSGRGVPETWYAAGGGQRPRRLSAVSGTILSPAGFWRRPVLRFGTQDAAGADRRRVPAHQPCGVGISPGECKNSDGHVWFHQSVLPDAGVAGSVQPLSGGWVSGSPAGDVWASGGSAKGADGCRLADRAIGPAAADRQGSSRDDRRAVGEPTA